jgi:hypothetical protein
LNLKKLNTEQLTIRQEINALKSGDRLVVSGRAGSGKTFAITNSVAKRKALFLAPTHPACSVLEHELSDKSHTISTIHKAIGWKRVRNPELNYVDYYQPASEQRELAKASDAKKANLFSEADIIIVDEFSMVGSFLFNAIEDYANEYGIPVVYSGDCYQLPPVGDIEVIMDQGFKTIMMTTSMRFPPESEIFRLSEQIRDSIALGSYGKVPFIQGGDEVQVIGGVGWMNELTNDYDKGNSILALTSDNETNKRLRGRIRRVDQDRFDEGDVVSSKKTDDLFRNGEQLTVDTISSEINILHDVPKCLSTFHTLSIGGSRIAFVDAPYQAFTAHNEQEIKNLERKVRSLHSEGKLNREQAINVLDWLEQFNSFELITISTVHKSQGRSVDTAYIDTNTVLNRPTWLVNRDHLRLIYTAITRARKKVVFYSMAGLCSPKPTNIIAWPEPPILTDKPLALAS